MHLDPETQRLMREFFDRQTCCKCEMPANRFTGNRFYCAPHFPRGRDDKPGGPKVYKHPRL